MIKTSPISGNSPKLLIVGQGIAGSAIAANALSRGLSISVVDSGFKHSASYVSSGLINPLTGRHLHKSWMIDQLLSSATEFYSGIESSLGEKLYKKTEILRKIPGVKEENDWLSLVGTSPYIPYLPDQEPMPMVSSIFGSGSKSISVHTGFFINIKVLLELYRNHLKSIGALIEETFDYSHLQLRENYFVYQDTSFDYVIFCEGYKSLSNPYFSNIPIYPNKGQCLILDLELPNQMPVVSPGILTPYLYNYTYFGSTYERGNSNNVPDAAGRELLLEMLNEMITLPAKVKDHMSGIRATTPDRKPLIGRHKEFSNMILFNGFGTKGLSLAPYFAKQLIAHILGEVELNPEINPYRFKNL